MKRKREKDLKTGIKAIDHRLEQLLVLLETTTCPLCQLYPVLCGTCPARATVYGCFDFVEDINQIRHALLNQKTKWLQELKDALK